MSKPSPMRGMDLKVWESNYVQFPRLLSEILAMGLQEEQVKHLNKVMDLEGLELQEILIRADRKWERIKAAYKKRGKRHAGAEKEVEFQ